MSDVPETLPDSIREALQGLLDAIDRNTYTVEAWPGFIPERQGVHLEPDVIAAINEARAAIGGRDG